MSSRKKWTPSEPTGPVLVTREKKKWQIALRRYILEKQPSTRYAPYFGIDVERFRNWIALQFEPDLNWDNFGTRWQLEHVLPSQYFQLEKEEERRLCWNFINIRVERISETGGIQPGVLGAIPYFTQLLEMTGSEICSSLLQKINLITGSAGNLDEHIAFLISQKEELKQLANFSEDEMLRLNQGESLDSIIKEKEILKKFGS